MKASRALYQILRDYGVRYLFGMDSPELLYQEIDRSEIRPITVRDERSGAHMADGYARVAFGPAICTAIQGPGSTNLVTGIAEAFVSCVPVIAIASAVDSSLIGKNSIQELDQVRLFEPITKWVTRIDDPDRLPELVRKAFRIATTGKPGPVVLNIPPDTLERETDADMFVELEYNHVPGIRVGPNPERIREAAKLLVEAERPGMVAGGGVLQSGAWNEVKELAELLAMPVATTMMGKGTIPETHYLSVGVMGTYTSGRIGRGSVANKVIQESDVVMLVGTRTDQIDTTNWSVPTPQSKIIHIDIDPTEIGRNYRTSVEILGDAKLSLALLIETIKTRIAKGVGKSSKQERLEEIHSMLDNWRSIIGPETHSETMPINPQRLVEELRDFVDSETILAADASYSSMWALSHLDAPTTGRVFVSPRGLGGIGAGFPMSLGAKLAAPEKRVVCMVGDGGFAYAYHELETAARYKIAVVTVVLNNQCLAFQKHYERFLYGKSVECDFLDVDYGQLARTLRCHGARVERPSEIRDTLKVAFDSGQPSVVDVVIDPEKFPAISYFDKFDLDRGAKARH